MKREEDPTHLSARVEGFVARVPLVKEIEHGRGGLTVKRLLIIVFATCSVCFLLAPAGVAVIRVPVAINVEVRGGSDGDTPGYATIYSDIYYDDVVANPDKTFTWYLKDPLMIAADNDPGQILAIIGPTVGKGLSISLKADPFVNVGFSVAAGQYDTAFSFSSPVVNFGPFNNPDAQATASVSITRPGDKLYNGGFALKAYRALYNGTSVFADLVDTPYPGGIVGPATVMDFTGWQQIPGSVSSMQAQWRFIVSAGGSATGSSDFEIIPEPATILLLGIGGLALLRRRK